MCEQSVKTIEVERFNFETPEQLAQSLAHRVASELTLEMCEYGHASLVVSGGRTPALFFKALSNLDIDWQYVTISLADERYVPVNSDRSNEKFVKDHLLCNAAAKAKFIGLYNYSSTVESAAFIAASRIDNIARPFTVVILGMGEDGHTASFFPDCDRLQQLLDLKGKALILPVRAKSIAEPRLTMTLPLLVSARFLALHLEGYKKLSVLEKALKDKKDLEFSLPVHSVLKNAHQPVKIYWSVSEKEILAYDPEEPILTGLFSVPIGDPDETQK